MKNTNVSRRKFLGSLGAAVGAAVAVPAFKSMDAIRAGKAATLALAGTRNKLAAFASLGRPVAFAKTKVFRPLKVVSRLEGTSRLKLSVRPF